MDRGTVKSSTIFIAAGNQTSVYRSVEEVPTPLRKKLTTSTSSVNSATILIADRRGREEIARLIRSLPANVQARLMAAMGGGSAGSNRSTLLAIARWAGVLVAAAIGVLAWVLFSAK